MKDKESKFCLKAPLGALARIVPLIPVAPLLPMMVSAIMQVVGREYVAR